MQKSICTNPYNVLSKPYEVNLAKAPQLYTNTHQRYHAFFKTIYVKSHRSHNDVLKSVDALEHILLHVDVYGQTV